MSVRQTTHQPIERIAESATGPRQLIDDICMVLDDQDGEFEQLSQILWDLTERIESQFAREEQGDHYEEATFHAPWLTAEAESLKQQHVELRQVLGSLNWQARGSNTTPDRWQQLQRNFDDFVERFIEHEAGEYNLLQEAYVPENWRAWQIDWAGPSRIRFSFSIGNQKPNAVTSR